MMGIRQKEETAGTGGLHNTLATGTCVKGNISTETDFRLDGQVDGDVTCSGKIIVGAKGRVGGNITAQNAEIMGEVQGSVEVQEKLVLKASSLVKGDITTQVLEIEPGASFNGACKMQAAEAGH